MTSPINESTEWLYGKLTGLGYNVGKDVNEFDNLMRTNAESRQWAYDTARKNGLNVGKDMDEFSSLVGGTVAPPPAAAPAQPAQQAQPQQQAVTPTVQPIKDNTAQQASVQSATTPAQPAGWKPFPEQQYMQRQMDQANQRLKKMGDDFHRRMEGIEKGNRPGACRRAIWNISCARLAT